MASEDEQSASDASDNGHAPRAAAQTSREHREDARFLDRFAFFLLSRCDETAPLDRYFKGVSDSLRRVLSFLFDLFPTRRSSAA